MSSSLGSDPIERDSTSRSAASRSPACVDSSRRGDLAGPAEVRVATSSACDRGVRFAMFLILQNAAAGTAAVAKMFSYVAAEADLTSRLQTERQLLDPFERDPDPFGTMVQLIGQFIERLVENERREEPIERVFARQ